MGDFNIEDAIKESTISVIVEKAITKFELFFKNKSQSPTLHSQIENYEKNLVSNFNELYNWSKEIEFIGLGGKPISVLYNSIDLNFNYSLHRNGTKDEQKTEAIKEDDVIFTQSNVVIEGHPGTGKTTTLKRLISSFFFAENKELNNPYSYPILLRFRTIEDGQDLFSHLSSILGIRYSTQVPTDNDGDLNIINNNQKNKYIQSDKKINPKPLRLVGEERLETVIKRLLEDNEVLLIMDGFDEIKPELAEEFTKQINSLSLAMSKSKIILTARPNFTKGIHENFTIYSVNKLSSIQIKAITELWIGDSILFIKELESKSYKEIANRPLFLCFLLLLYKEPKSDVSAKLPKSSREVYKRLIEVLILKWDSARGICRVSKYSNFEIEKKIDFLTHLAFHLTYIVKEKTFTHDLLIRAYKSICEHFDLPPDEAPTVANEIEDYTGLIIKSFYDKYEFSHLALQEYLCASYIVRAPFDEKIENYLKEYPAPLALAVAMSSDCSSWLAELIARMIKFMYEKDSYTQLIPQIFDRLMIESPIFTKNKKLGVYLLKLFQFSFCPPEVVKSFDTFIKSNPNIELSVKEAFSCYKQPGAIDTAFEVMIFYKLNNEAASLPPRITIPLNSYLLKELL